MEVGSYLLPLLVPLIKGTRENIVGLMDALKSLIRSANLTLRDIDLVRINEATPVIGDVAMETIIETIITESTMIGSLQP